MNHITRDQNQPNNLERLAAQRQLYSRAKSVLGWQISLTGPIAGILAFAVLAYPSLRSFNALWGFAVTLADLVLLTPWIERLRLSAAKIQEQFDCDVLQLPWNAVKAGVAPNHESVSEAAQRYRSSGNSMPPLENWYPTLVNELPLHVARLICQRENCWWDSAQRRRYALAVAICTGGLILVVLFIAVQSDPSLVDFILGVLAPLTPALVLGYRQANEHMKAANRLDDLRVHVDRAWADALSGHPAHTVTNRSRILQDEIFDNRKRSPLIFDRVFAYFRNTNERTMNRSAAYYAEEARKRLRL